MLLDRKPEEPARVSTQMSVRPMRRALAACASLRGVCDTFAILGNNTNTRGAIR